MGLGEAIVSGLVPGSALSSVAKKDALDKPRVRPLSHALAAAWRASRVGFHERAERRHHTQALCACMTSAAAGRFTCCTGAALPLPVGHGSRWEAGMSVAGVWRGTAQVVMYPSKSDGMFVPESLIFRSDSNGARQLPMPASILGPHYVSAVARRSL